MGIGTSISRLAARSVLRTMTIAALVIALAACSGGVLDPQGAVGKAQRTILYDATVIMLAVVVPVIILTLAFAWWFRAGNRKARYLPEWDYSGPIEMITWSVPTLVIVFLGGMAWIGSHELDPPKPLVSSVKPIDVEVVALDWRWLFIYPGEKLASLNHLTVPVGVPIHFRITSTSVMNSFFIPQLGSQIYAMPGMTTQLYLQADHAGTYQGLSAQFSGDGFSDMRFEVTAVSASAFAEWVHATKSAGGALDQATFAVLEKPAHAAGVTTYADVESGLFDVVASSHMTMNAPHEDH